MKSIFKYMIWALAAAFAFAACAPEEFVGADGNIPVLSEYESAIDIQVDQETNTVTFNLNAAGVMPVWYFDTEKANAYSTVNGFKKIYTIAGDYTVDVKILNRNGMSDGVVKKTFHIDNSIVDYTKYTTMIAGTDSKEWRINNEVQGHLGCGEPGTDGLNWWSAPPDDKKDWGVYDDILTFGADGSYSYNPGEGGTVYVNKDVTLWKEHNTNDGNDFMAPVDAQTSTYEFTSIGTDLYVKFPANTLFPYIPYDDIYANPLYKVLSITPKAMELVVDNGAISWHYTLTSEKGAVVFNGFKYDSEFNLWKKATVGEPVFWFGDESWQTMPNPECAINNGAYSFTMVEPSTSQWMRQFSILSDVQTSAANNYDFSVVVTTSTDHPNVTFKLVQDGDDGLFYFEEKVALKAFEDYVYWKSDMPGLDMTAVKLVLDFGGNAANTEVTVKNVVLKNHADDDGTVLPDSGNDGGDDPAQPDWVAVDSQDNIWNTIEKKDPTYYYAPGWAQIANPEMTTDGKSWTLKFPEATTDRWQNQFAIPTSMTATMDDALDFKVTIYSSASFTAFVKLTQADEPDTKHDNNFFFANDVVLTEYEETTFWLSNVKLPLNDAHQVDLVFDFGGNPAGAEVTIKDIVIQKHKKDPSEIEWAGPESDANLWYKATKSDPTYYYAPGWAQIANPEMTTDGKSWTLKFPEATTDRWQNQFAIPTDMSATKDDLIDAKVTINSSAAFTAFVKLTQADEADTKHDNNYFFAQDLPLAEYEDATFMIVGAKLSDGTDAHALNFVFDFGGNPAGAEVTIKDIVIQKHVE